MEDAALNVIEYLSITKTERSWSEEPDVKKNLRIRQSNH